MEGRGNMKILKEAQKKLHDLLDWGYPLKRVGSDSFHQNYSCRFCTKEITQDSTGAWFHLMEANL